MSITVHEAISVSPWTDEKTPRTSEQWLARAAEVAAILATDAVERDRAQAVPYAEVQLLKDSGLVTLLGPAEFGGAHSAGRPRIG